MANELDKTIEELEAEVLDELEEANGNEKKVYDLIKRSFKKLAKSGVNISRDQWLNEAI